MSLDLDAIRARADAATEGPWETTQAQDEESTTWIEAPYDDVLHHDERGYGHMRENFAWMKRADAEFIAHARTDIPRLLAALDAVEALVGEVWDDGNATGLDGWVGPGRGTAPVDDEAIDYRQRAIDKIRAAITGALGD